MKATLDIRWRRMTGMYQHGWVCEVGDGVNVGHIYQPTQSKGYNGPRWRPETTLPGIRVRQGILKETEDEAKALLVHLVHQWFQRCGVVPSPPPAEDAARPV